LDKVYGRGRVKKNADANKDDDSKVDIKTMGFECMNTLTTMTALNGEIKTSK
jgi:hypothetical protein